LPAKSHITAAHVFALALIISITARCQPAISFTVENLHSLPANIEIVWKAQTNNLPAKLPVFIVIKQGFSDTVNREALLMAHCPATHAADATTQNLVIQDGEDESWKTRIMILPLAGEIEFEDRSPINQVIAVPDAAEVSRRAWDAAARFQLPRNQLLENSSDQKSEVAQSGPLVGQICTRDTFLTRRLHNIDMRNFGLAFRLGNRGQIRYFSLRWPQLRMAMNFPVAPPSEMAANFRERIIPASTLSETNLPVIPDALLARTRSLVVTNMTPFYAEAACAAIPNPTRRERYISPFAELQATADLGGTNASLTFYTELVTRPPSH
jgi:hypothetical protein